MDADEGKKQLTPLSLPPAPRLDLWLVFFHGRREQNQTFYSLSEKRYHVKNIPDLRRIFICTCSHGWLVLDCKYSGDCFLLNPISMDKRQLPLCRPFIYDSCVLSSSPNDPNCVVLFINYSQEGRVSVMYCQPSDKDWIVQDLELEEGNIINKVVCCGGKIYGLTFPDHKVVIFDVGTTLTIKEIVREALPEPSLPNTVMHNSYMVESCGELFVFRTICLGLKEIQHIEVFKVDFSGKVWVRVESLGDRAFFLGPSCSTSCSVKESGIKGDTIYFTLPKDRSLYAFNYKEKGMTMTLPCPNIKNHWSQPKWVLPLV